jgi:predicted enzyme related to lactoylglutathione lyase
VCDAPDDDPTTAPDLPAVTSLILNVTIDCLDSESVARFWAAVTGWPASKQEMPGNPFWLVGPPDGDGAGSEDGLGPGPRLVFVEVAEGKAAKNRVHLDLVPASAGPTAQGDEVARLEALGARIVDDRRHVSPGGWVVMADPEDNEFCLEGGD